MLMLLQASTLTIAGHCCCFLAPLLLQTICRCFKVAACEWAGNGQRNLLLLLLLLLLGDLVGSGLIGLQRKTPRLAAGAH